ncbi:hypothetical protein DFP72DRAFT_846853 [Ephemerocybe angulata]|uniref:Uncharacterized protein n=1 Tax=Ephemerocybe angulata TaxID=980116 RepID=A0A8H6M612_9AGAR|nr:hypothetical protein DFP72DRAFT_846853 [Tulosesus angulatus]
MSLHLVWAMREKLGMARLRETLCGGGGGVSSMPMRLFSITSICPFVACTHAMLHNDLGLGHTIGHITVHNTRSGGTNQSNVHIHKYGVDRSQLASMRPRDWSPQVKRSPFLRLPPSWSPSSPSDADAPPAVQTKPKNVLISRASRGAQWSNADAHIDASAKRK